MHQIPQPPEMHDLQLYEEFIYQKSHQSESKIFHATFTPDGEYLVACNSRGRISCWRMGQYLVGH